MQVTARPYLVAGVALVGASAIAVSPMAPPAPDVQIPAIHASSASVALTAAANPLELWAEVMGTAFENVGGLGEQWLADPAPILRQIIANQLHSASVLSASAQTLADGLAEAFDPDSFFSFTASIQQAFDQIAAGEFEEGFAAIPASLLYLGLPLIAAIGNQFVPGAWSVIAQPFTNLAKLVTQFPDALPALFANGLLSPMMATAAASGHTLESLVDSATGGDAASFANTLVNAPATVTGALLNGYEIDGYLATGLLNAREGFTPGGSISAVLSALTQIADSIKTPGADRDDLLGNLPGLEAAPESLAVNSTLNPTAKTVTLDVAPADATPATPQAGSSTEEDKEPESAATAAPDGDSVDAGSTPTADLVKVSPKAEPGKIGTGPTNSDRAKPLKAVRDGASSAVKNVTDGLKKATAGLSGKKETTKGDTGSNTAGSESGGGSE
ncbi:hypothetical protein [Mycolicibacterium sp. XJ870]